MYLRLTPPLSVRVTGFSFKQGLSATLTTITTVGAFTVVYFNSNSSKESIIKALEPFKEALLNDTLLSGINKVSSTLHSWGTSIVATKDDFKAWLDSYLGPEGLKSGTVTLYNKLNDWGLIVYRWFRDKFWKFITNIPDMVQNWRKLRLSLFKWGTFLGGGGGSALWAMFGSGDNWGKLSALMEREDFGEMMSTFADLVEKNDEAFSKMDQDEMQEIIEQYLNEPEKAQKAAKDLLEKQKEMADKAKEEQEKNKDQNREEEEQKEPQLEKQEIQEAFSPSKGGKPQSPAEVLGNMIGEGLSSLVGFKYSSFDSVDAGQIAKINMNKYLDIIENDVKAEKSKKRKETAKQQFWDAVNGNKNDLVNALSEVAKDAYDKLKKTPANLEELSKEFVEVFNSKFTKECQDSEEGCGTANFDV